MNIRKLTSHSAIAHCATGIGEVVTDRFGDQACVNTVGHICSRYQNSCEPHEHWLVPNPFAFGAHREPFTPIGTPTPLGDLIEPEHEHPDPYWSLDSKHSRGVK